MNDLNKTLGGWRSIGVGSGWTLGGIVAAVALFIQQWAESGNINEFILGVVGLLIAVFFGGRSYQQGKSTEQ